MSHTTIIHVYPGHHIEPDEELQNSWGSAMPVWIVMTKQYLHREYSINQDHSPLWALWKDKRIPKEHRAVLMLTFDRAYIAKQNYKRMAQAIGRFLNDFYSGGLLVIGPAPASDIFRAIQEQEYETVNHWAHIKAIFVDDPDVPGIGLWCTSVSDNPFLGRWNDEQEEYDPLDWSEVYEIFEKLDELDKSNK